MVTDVPDALLRRCVDTLALAHRVRERPYPTGCGLDQLAEHNLRDPRAKPSYAQSASGLRPGIGIERVLDYVVRAVARSIAGGCRVRSGLPCTRR